MTKEIAKKRIAWIDLLETIAISMVVLYHCTAYIGGVSQPSISGAGFYIYYFFRSIFAVCVPLFFFVNGYLLFRQQFNFRKHLRKILKFILIALFWYAATLLIMTILRPEEISNNGFLTTLFNLRSNINYLWYLGALVCLYILFPILKVVYDHNVRVFCYFVIVCLVLTLGNSVLNEGLTLILWLLNKPALLTDINFFSIFNPLRGVYVFSFLYFCLGGITCHYWDKIKNILIKKRNLVAIALLAVGWLGSFGVGLLYSHVSGTAWDNVWYGYGSIWTLCGVLGIFLLSLNWQRQSRLLSTISRNTLGIYLTHMIIIYIATIFLSELLQPLNPLTSSSIVILLFGNLIYGAAVLSISLIISLILRKIPIVRRSIS